MRRALTALILVSLVDVQMYANPEFQPATRTSSKIYAISKYEVEVVSALLATILEYIDHETRHGCSDKDHPRYFPQHPNLSLMYKGGGFAPDVWRRFRGEVRQFAPAVTLIPYDKVVSGTYIVDVTSVQTTQPIATATYRHSAFSFGSEFDSQPIFGGPGREGPPSVAGVLKTNQAVFALGIEKNAEHGIDYAWATTLTLGKSNFVREEEESQKIKDKPEMLQAITEGIKKFELALPERERMQPVDYDNLVKGVTAFDHSPRADAQNVVRATLHEMFPKGTIVFAGVYRTYLLERGKDGWQVLDSNTISFTDHLLIEICNEP